MRRTLATFAAVAAAATLPLAPPAAAEPAAEPAAYSSYVALGDSFTSTGPMFPERVQLPCARSAGNYPSLVAHRLEPSEFTDVSCGGATTEHMAEPQWGIVNQPQFDALRPGTDLVTVGIGGNDIPFAEVVLTCGSMGLVAPAGSPCKDFYVSAGTDELAAKVRAVGPKVGAVLRGIRDRAPDAEVLLVGYPSLLPDSGANCWPLVPIARGDAPYLRDITKLLNRMLAERAAAEGAVFVDTYTSSIGHDMCEPPGEKWVEGILPTSPAVPVHPNGLGSRNQARQILATLGRS
ncbi:SGNH/GDSL hydrolase family protein [Amycolatopsis cihanbeyliensis]|uniref:GDSL-like lipase/acylhydrolase family protein n=1 Tax=Amycolatopsis cihanbeyliensis TaxID=1128664 RepID=A0A542DIP1_AMYCI|nr:SGNH/GDSL hydrolase family protein [Amycolatopsis cihanbeyliensis]TQJ02943.1 GDSL-like lipase/acylhydrolase family protein [Amycolatopsis cihanbeyliensis]